jgi:hypothetical protein
MSKKTAIQPTSAEREQRVLQVKAWLLAANPRSVIIKNCEDRWGVGFSAADRYVTEARALISAEAKERTAQAAELSQQWTLDLLRRAREAGDRRAEAAALDLWNKTHGVYASVKVQVSGPDEGPIKVQASNLDGLTFEQLYELRHGRKPEGGQDATDPDPTPDA